MKNLVCNQIFRVMKNIKRSTDVNREIGISEAARILAFPKDRVRREIEFGALRSKIVDGQVKMLFGDVLSFRKFARERRRLLAFLVQQAQDLKLGYGAK